MRRIAKLGPRITVHVARQVLPLTVQSIQLDPPVKPEDDMSQSENGMIRAEEDMSRPEEERFRFLSSPRISVGHVKGFHLVISVNFSLSSPRKRGSRIEFVESFK